MTILSESENAGKSFVINLLFKGLDLSQPCDSSFCDDNFKLPEWYDDVKFKRGQQYFSDNQAGIMLSNLYGLFSLICEPTGAKVLDRTGMSSTPETAKKRYVSTSIHMLSWYQSELKPGSKSWESLKRVRKMHLLSSRNAENHGLGMIAQSAMTMTQFGFMGYALVRSHLLGIKSDNDEDRQAFVHLWAVIGSMLGIKDEFNMCLNPLDVVEVICRILIRYVFIPQLQLETPTFKKLGEAFVEGMRTYIPFSTYESRLFQARRLAGVPGYQYDVDMSKEFFISQIFTADEIQKIVQNVAGYEYRKSILFSEKMYLLDIKRFESYRCHDNESLLDNMDENRNIFGLYKVTNDENNNITKSDDGINHLIDVLELQHPSELMMTEVDEAKIKQYLNDRKFYELSKRDQWFVKLAGLQVKHLGNRLTRFPTDVALAINIYRMERFLKNTK